MNYVTLNHRFKTANTLAPWLSTKLADGYSIKVKGCHPDATLIIVDKFGTVEVTRPTTLLLHRIDLPDYLLKGEIANAAAVQATW